MLSYDQINRIAEALGPQAPPLIDAFQTLEQSIEEQKQSVKKDLVVELATKADIERLGGDTKRLDTELKGEIKRVETELKGEIKRLETELKGDIKRLETEIKGEIKRLELLMKVLIGLSILGMAFFSPNAAELLRLLK